MPYCIDKDDRLRGGMAERIPQRSSRTRTKQTGTTRAAPPRKASNVADEPRRARRATGEVRELILEAARASFEERGYARSTTRDIADRAGVAEVLIFRKFGSKANLFAEAALLPVVELVEAWVGVVQPSTDADVVAQQHEFTEYVYKVASDNRGLLLSFFATAAFEPDVVEEQNVAQLFQRAIDDLVAVCEQRLERRGVDLTDVDVGIAGRASIGMILAMALLGDWLLPSGRRRPRTDDVLDELTRLVLYGAFNQKPPLPPRR